MHTMSKDTVSLLCQWLKAQTPNPFARAFPRVMFLPLEYLCSKPPSIPKLQALNEMGPTHEMIDNVFPQKHMLQGFGFCLSNYWHQSTSPYTHSIFSFVAYRDNLLDFLVCQKSVHVRKYSGWNKCLQKLENCF